MNCPECNSDDVINMSKDPIPCTDCGSTIVVEYFMCTSCGYNFRTTNNKFLDGCHPVEMERIIKDILDDFVDDVFENSCDGCGECGPTSMMDTICNCVRCGKVMVFSPDQTEYTCPYCGFEWDIIESR